LIFALFKPSARLEGDRCAATDDLRVKTALSPWHMRLLATHIDTHLEKAITNQELADIVKLSASQFSWAFKRSFGSPPHHYIVRLRNGRARKLMWTTGTSLAHIAVACGFADQAHFCSVFRKYEGETPAAWRRAAAIFAMPTEHASQTYQVFFERPGIA
jgi:AraC family transcriptional regulator